jgi:hypothetical protein
MGGKASISPLFWFKIASVTHKYHMKFIFQWRNKEIKEEEDAGGTCLKSRKKEYSSAKKTKNECYCLSQNCQLACLIAASENFH